MKPTTMPPRPLANVLAYASLIVFVAMGIRRTFGLFLTPMSMEHQWSREVFSFALALQNLIWGATQPFAGCLADRHGARRVLWGASVLYALGLLGILSALIYLPIDERSLEARRLAAA
jgi:MFS family permease